MVKLLAFDIDNTLAEINKPIMESTMYFLRLFEEKGTRIAFVSGKPAIYISGMVRQLGLDNPIIIGENGLDIFYGSAVPPVKSIEADTSDMVKKKLLRIKEVLIEEFSERIWFQPNAVSVTAFPKDITDMDKLVERIGEVFKDESIVKDLVYYKHSDSIDIAPKNVHKGNALNKLLQKEGWAKEEVIAIGDGENDIPMFNVSGYTIGVNFKGDYNVGENFRSIHDALKFIENKFYG
ncbi:HAD family hydrolase [[Bacillus] enclensis]|uniref:HAD family hydrolase n=1 Tax=[Bacillus] enclensis TaxID=1402860 RepID=UPI0018DEAA38|nr:HAD family hydrolase [[Bacillus] enclensis]MBH9967970.1 HAD family phosphatase [[Bacillus] enclensis]